MSRYRIPFLTAAAAAFAGLGLILILWPSTPSPDSGKGGTSPRGESTAPSTPLPTSAGPEEDHEGEAGDGHHHATSPAQMKLVDRFAQAFAAGGPQRTWLSELKPYVTSDLLDGFRYTDPARRLTGKVRQVTAVADLEHVFTVTYASGARIACTIAANGSGWLVSKVEPVKAADHTGTDV